MATAKDIGKEGYSYHDGYSILPKELVIERLIRYPYKIIHTRRQKSDNLQRLHIYKGILNKRKNGAYFIDYNQYIISIKFRAYKINKYVWEDLGFKFNNIGKDRKPSIYLDDLELSIILKDIRRK